ncbi:microsomal signal peptidase 12 kDa subunit-domain-containing protein [Syncephalis plumigaleata]|nr:microsomal signal peptidase 12 kDa subunit-domain-containing protein [Syncephalis plumigaleata]
MSMTSWNQWLEGGIDFEGQKLAEQLSQQLLVVNIIISLVYGYWTQSISNMLLVYGIGYFISLIACVPTWSFYNRHPIRWLPEVTSTKTEGEKKE